MSLVTSNDIVVGVFGTPDQARQAVEDLRAEGFPQDTISMVIRSNGSDRTRDESSDAESVRRGDAIVTVRAVDVIAADRAVHVMNDSGAVDINGRVSDWRERGWKGHDPGLEPLSEDELRRGRTSGHEDAHDIGESLVDAVERAH